MFWGVLGRFGVFLWACPPRAHSGPVTVTKPEAHVKFGVIWSLLINAHEFFVIFWGVLGVFWGVLGGVSGFFVGKVTP